MQCGEQWKLELRDAAGCSYYQDPQSWNTHIGNHHPEAQKHSHSHTDVCAWRGHTRVTDSFIQGIITEFLLCAGQCWGPSSDYNSPVPCPHGACSPVGETDSKQTNIYLKIVINTVERTVRDNHLTNTVPCIVTHRWPYTEIQSYTHRHTQWEMQARGKTVYIHRSLPTCCFTYDHTQRQVHTWKHTQSAGFKYLYIQIHKCKLGKPPCRSDSCSHTWTKPSWAFHRKSQWFHCHQQNHSPTVTSIHSHTPNFFSAWRFTPALVTWSYWMGGMGVCVRDELLKPPSWGQLPRHRMEGPRASCLMREAQTKQARELEGSR